MLIRASALLSSQFRSTFYGQRAGQLNIPDEKPGLARQDQNPRCAVVIVAVLAVTGLDLSIDRVRDRLVSAPYLVYWRTQVLELSEYPARAWESSRHNPFPSSMRLKRTGQSPRPSGGRIQHQKGSLQRHAWSDGRYPKV